MTAILIGLALKLWPYIAGALALGFGLLRYGAKKQAAGYQKAMTEVDAGNTAAIKEISNAEKATSTLSDDELAQRLSDQQGHQ